MTFIIPSIVEILMDKITLWISIRANDGRVERVIIASYGCQDHISGHFVAIYYVPKKLERYENFISGSYIKVGHSPGKVTWLLMLGVTAMMGSESLVSL